MGAGSGSVAGVDGVREVVGLGIGCVQLQHMRIIGGRSVNNDPVNSSSENLDEPDQHQVQTGIDSNVSDSHHLVYNEPSTAPHATGVRELSLARCNGAVHLASLRYPQLHTLCLKDCALTPAQLSRIFTQCPALVSLGIASSSGLMLYQHTQRQSDRCNKSNSHGSGINSSCSSSSSSSSSSRSSSSHRGATCIPMVAMLLQATQPHQQVQPASLSSSPAPAPAPAISTASRSAEQETCCDNTSHVGLVSPNFSRDDSRNDNMLGRVCVSGMDDSVLLLLLLGCPQLRSLKLHGCVSISDTGLRAVMVHGTRLRHLDLRGCSASDETCQQLQIQCECLRSFLLPSQSVCVH